MSESEDETPEHICSECGKEMAYRKYDKTAEHGHTAAEWVCPRCDE